MDERKGRILVVDDEPCNLQLLQQILENEYHLSFAPNGRMALEITRKVKPDLILLDIMMPDLNGFETCRRLKADIATDHIPIIFVTVMDEIEDEATGFSLGAVDFITKPFKPSIIRARIKTHLQLKQKMVLLEEMVSLDGFTELPNRKHFEAVFQVEWKRSKRSFEPFSLLLIGFDNFYQTIEMYGHSLGDDCLLKVAHHVKHILKRPGDMTARYERDQFCILLPNTDKEGALKIAKEITAPTLIINHFQKGKHISIPISLSIGIMTRTQEQNIMPSLFLERIKKAVYKAKRDGGNRIYNAEDMDIPLSVH